MNGLDEVKHKGLHAVSAGDDSAWPAGSEAAQALCAEVTRAASFANAPPVGTRTRVWARIEARRESRVSRGWSRLAFGAAGIAGVAAAAGVTVIAARGIAGNGVDGASVGEHFAIADGAASRRLDVHGEARVVLSPSTRADLVEDDAHGLAFSVAHGSLLCDVSHRPDGAPFYVHTPRADVKVVGTVLWVDVADDGSATVLVGRGAVEVSAHGVDSTGAPNQATVGAGERWPAASVRSPAPHDLALLDDLRKGIAKGPLEVTRFAAPAPAIAPTTPVAEPAPVVPAPPAAAPSAPSANACAELGGGAAVSCFNRLAGSPDALRAESALYEMGWRQLRELGDARSALATWTGQRERFPRGALRSEADVSIIQAAVKLDDRALARREAEAWLRAHPDALSAPEVHFLLGTVERADGRCARALHHFDVALKSPADPWAAEARSQREACQSH